MWRFLFGRHALLEQELEALKLELNHARGELHKSLAIRQALAERAIQLESELKGIHWILEKFFGHTPFWTAVQRFMGQHEKGNANDSLTSSSKRNTYR